MKNNKPITLSVGVIVLSAAAFAAIPVIEKAQSRDSTEILLDGNTKYRTQQSALYLPYLIEPTYSQWWQCRTFDLNNDYEEWIYTTHYESTCFAYFGDDTKADDWVIMPAVHLPRGMYRISCDYQTDSWDKQDFRLAIGTTANPSRMTQTVLDCPNIERTDDFTRASNEFFVKREGVYYIGLYCYSSVYRSYLYVKDIAIESIDPLRPEPPTIESIDFTSTDGTITIKAPTKRMNGESLGSAPMLLDVFIDNEAVEGSPFSITAGSYKEIDLTLSGDVHTVSTLASYKYDGYNKASDMTSQDFQVTRIMEIPMPMPAYLIPDKQQFDACTVIDANNNDNTWYYDTGQFVYYSDPPYNSNNDWLILPAMHRGDTDYFELKYVSQSFELINYNIYVASEPTAEAMLAGKLLDNEIVIPKASNVTERSIRFKYTDSDIFYIGIHAYNYCFYSDGRNAISNVEVKPYNGASPKSPVFADFSFDGGNGEVIFHLPRLCFDETTINAEKVSVNLKIDGEDVSFATGAPGATVSIPVTDLALGEHTFYATASYVKDGATLTSETAIAKHKILRPSSFSYTIPLNIDFTSDKIANDLIIIDHNNDGYTWELSDELFFVGNNEKTADADDWVILLAPVLIEDASNTYRITVNATTTDSTEEFAVYYGSEPTVDKMNNRILDESHFTTGYNVWTDCTDTFKVPEPGRYYLGIRCLSVGMYGILKISSMKIEIATTNEDPGIVEKLTATPDPTGQLNATVAFDMPTLNRGGEEMAADTRLTATVSSSVDTKTVTGTPGQKVSTAINTVKGKNTISVTAKNSHGQSDKATVTVYCGLDTPKAPVITSTATSEDGLSAILTWNPVTSGIHAGDVQDIKYRVSVLLDQTTGSWSEGEVTTNTKYELRLPAGTPQEYYTIGVSAFIYDGIESSISQTKAVAGQPYTPDLTEVFANNEITYRPIYTMIPPQSTFIPEWLFDFATNYWPDAAITDQKMLIGRTYSNTGDCDLMLPLVNTTDAEIVDFSFDVYYDSAITPAMTVYAQTYGSERMLLGELATPAQPGWHTYTFTLPDEMLDRSWIQMCIVTGFANAKQFALIKGYKLSAKYPDGIKDLLAGNVSVLASTGNIAINGAEGRNITVSDLAGKVVYSAKGQSNGIVIPAAAGVHIVRIDNKSYKVMVK